MTADFYADQFKRYATYARNYPGAPLKRIASGANSADYNWTDVMMRKARGQMWGLSMHYYTIPSGSWSHKGSATSFTEQEYFNTMKNCLFMEELVTKHSAIMDKYDSAKRVALAVDEWGIWTDVEPGTNPGFLYQQNSLRDALVAATTLNIFNNHCDRVRLANLAQTVNVLQALVLTKKEKMLLTPTYYVFDLYKVHHDAKLLPLKALTPEYKMGNLSIPAINGSASIDSQGRVHLTLVNLDPNKPYRFNTTLQNINWNNVTGQILTSGKLTDINTFENPYKVHLENFNGARKEGNQLVIDLPAQSIITLELK
jgi:alpha-L-arabinofuranosidase